MLKKREFLIFWFFLWFWIFAGNPSKINEETEPMSKCVLISIFHRCLDHFASILGAQKQETLIEKCIEKLTSKKHHQNNPKASKRGREPRRHHLFWPPRRSPPLLLGQPLLAVFRAGPHHSCHPASLIFFLCLCGLIFCLLGLIFLSFWYHVLTMFWYVFGSFVWSIFGSIFCTTELTQIPTSQTNNSTTTHPPKNLKFYHCPRSCQHCLMATTNTILCRLWKCYPIPWIPTNCHLHGYKTQWSHQCCGQYRAQPC